MNLHHVWMEFQQLRYAIAVAEERNFTRAAQRCRVVQSALSHQIKALERELGVALFARSSRKVEVTEAGENFLIHARTSLDAAARAAESAAATDGLIRGSLTIGVIPTATALDLPAALRAFRERHPLVKIRLRGGGSNEFTAAIAAGSMDVAILGLPSSEQPAKVAARELHRETLVAVLSAAHPLSARRRLHLRDLAEETFIDFPEGTPGRAQSDLAFAAAGVSREVMLDAMSTEMTLELVRQGLGISLLSAAVVPPDPLLVTVPVLDGPRRREYLAWSDFNPRPAARAFLTLLQEAPDPE